LFLRKVSLHDDTGMLLVHNMSEFNVYSTTLF
jgi:hypothetical protein